MTNLKLKNKKININQMIETLKDNYDNQQKLNHMWNFLIDERFYYLDEKKFMKNAKDLIKKDGGRPNNYLTQICIGYILRGLRDPKLTFADENGDMQSTLLVEIVNSVALNVLVKNVPSKHSDGDLRKTTAIVTIFHMLRVFFGADYTFGQNYVECN